VVIDRAPLVSWYRAATLLSGEAPALAALIDLEQVPGDRRRVIVEQADVPAAARPALEAAATITAPPPAVPGQVTRFDNDHVTTTVDAPAAGIVVLDEAAAPGWRVTDDDQAAPILRANLMLRAVAVPAGHHVIAWSFWPRRYGLWLTLFSCGLLALVVAAISALRRPRARPAR
jgi:hypothetical protein